MNDEEKERIIKRYELFIKKMRERCFPIKEGERKFTIEGTEKFFNEYINCVKNNMYSDDTDKYITHALFIFNLVKNFLDFFSDYYIKTERVMPDQTRIYLEKTVDSFIIDIDSAFVDYLFKYQLEHVKAWLNEHEKNF